MSVFTYRYAEEATIKYDHQSDKSFKVDMLRYIINKCTKSVAFRTWWQV
jgi:hypothetical protein